MEVTLEQIPSLAQRLLARLKPGSVVGLTGELGAGKTTLVRAMADALGVTEPVTSPTFTIMNVYGARGAIKRLAHVDYYRLEKQDFASTGIAEELSAKDTLTIIEWPEKMGDPFPQNAMNVHLEITGPTTRRVTIDPPL